MIETKEWTYRDKSKWGEGPWQSEPDKKQWTDSETGLSCMILRNHSGVLCGYVGVPDDHPFYRKDYHNLPDLDVHGGISFANLCDNDDRSLSQKERICHEAKEEVWWLGFDTGHMGDFLPGLREHIPEKYMISGESYKTLAYVEQECSNLAKQVKENA